MTSLKNELKQKAAFRNLEEETLLNILRTGDRLQIQLARLFRGHGITEPQYNVLRILRGAKGPLPCLEVGTRLVTVVPAITGLLDRLEKAGHIQRLRSESDRRVVLVEITKRGMSLIKDIDKPLVQLQKKLLGHMTRKKLMELSQLLSEARSTCT